ncbi:MAG: ABC transporter permease [Bacteroidota bacterium]|nr:ABC transporter permease [Bacteroidota bacterium]
MSFSYILKEGISGFRRTRLSMVISIFTITISLILLGAFAIIYRNASDIVLSFRNRVEMEAFLEEPIDEQTYPVIEKRLLAIPGIQSVRFISKEDAAEIFKKEFGEDIHSVLDFNPLPASFKIHLADGYKNSDSAAVIYQQLKATAGIDDVIYRKTLLELIDRRSRTFVLISLALGVGLTIAAIILVANTIRLAIYAKRKIITTMKLVGATRAFIRMPFVIEGIIQGFFGGIFSAGILFGVIHYAAQLLGNELAEIVLVQPWFYGAVAAAGIILGTLGSMFSIRKFIGESVG